MNDSRLSIFAPRRSTTDEREPFDVNQLERDISDAIPRPAPATPQIPLPSYADHRPDINDVGKVSAAFIASQCEQTAKAIEEMGEELIEAAKRAEAMADDVRHAVDEVRAAATRVRDQNKLFFERIEAVSVIAEKIKAQCAGFKLEASGQ